MNTRLLFAVVAITLAVGVVSEPIPLPPLPYALNALEPVFSEKAMNLHYNMHHKTYADKLGLAFDDARKNASLVPIVDQGVDYVLTQLHKFPEPLRTKIRNMGGGFVNHRLFWEVMRTPRENNAPTQGSLLLNEINKTFQSFDKFKEAFSSLGNDVFGSGWAWLYASPQDGNKIYIKSTANQDTPAMEQMIPLLTLDVWEHSYYVVYENRRAAYVTDWWKVVNWENVESRYHNAVNRAARRSHRNAQRNDL